MDSSSKALVKAHLRLRFPVYRIKYASNSKARTRYILIGLVLFLTLAYFSISLGFAAFSLILFGLGELVPLLAVVCGTVVTLLYTIFRAGSELFACKDYDLLMSLPVKTRTVVGVKCLVLWIENTSWIFLCMLPMGIIYLFIGKISLIGHLMWWLAILLVPLLPTVIAAVIGSLITAISSRFRYSKIVGAVLSIALVVMALFGSMQLSVLQAEGVTPLFTQMQTDFSSEQQLTEIAIEPDKIVELFYEQISVIYPPATLFAKAVIDSNVISFLGFLLFSIMPYALFVRLLSLRYKQINTALLRHRTKSNYTFRYQSQGSARFALYKKELKRFFTSTPYLVNLGVGPIMCLIFTISLCAFGADRLLESLDLLEIPFDIFSLIPYILAAILSMGCTTCVSISMEGKNVWQLKSLPISEREIYTSKIWVNLTLTIPTSLISSVIAVIALKPKIVDALLLFLIPVIFSVFSAVLGIVINTFFCKYDWENETQLVKRSVSSFLGLFSTSLLSVLFGSLAILLPVSAEIFSLVAMLIVGAGSFSLYQYVMKRPLP